MRRTNGKFEQRIVKQMEGENQGVVRAFPEQKNRMVVLVCANSKSDRIVNGDVKGANQSATH